MCVMCGSVQKRNNSNACLPSIQLVCTNDQPHNGMPISVVAATILYQCSSYLFNFLLLIANHYK